MAWVLLLKDINYSLISTSVRVVGFLNSGDYSAERRISVYEIKSNFIEFSRINLFFDKNKNKLIN